MNEEQIKVLERSIFNIDSMLRVVNVFCEYNEDCDGTLFLVPIVEEMQKETDKISDILW